MLRVHVGLWVLSSVNYHFTGVWVCRVVIEPVIWSRDARVLLSRDAWAVWIKSVGLNRSRLQMLRLVFTRLKINKGLKFIVVPLNVSHWHWVFWIDQTVTDRHRSFLLFLQKMSMLAYITRARVLSILSWGQFDQFLLFRLSLFRLNSVNNFFCFFINFFLPVYLINILLLLHDFNLMLNFILINDDFELVSNPLDFLFSQKFT